MKKTAVAAIFGGLILAAAVEFFSGWHRACRGYGNESAAYEPEILAVQDYVTEDGRWTVSGGEPYLLFDADAPGYISMEFSEPLESDTAVILYYIRDTDEGFDRLKRRERYMMKGTESAALTVPAGEWSHYRLDIRGNFSLAGLRIVPAVLPAEALGNGLSGQGSVLRVMLLWILCGAGLYFLIGNAESKKEAVRAAAPGGEEVSTGTKERRVYLDVLRSIAAVLVIVVHVVVPVTLLVPAGSFLRLAAEAVSFSSLTCNLLFVLISGALLLPFREEPFAEFAKKRLSGVVLPLMVYSVFYIRGLCITRTGAAGWTAHYLRTLISGEFIEAGHLWLIYVLLALYLSVIPFRYLLKAMPERVQKQLAVLILVLLAVRTVLLYFGCPMGLSVFWGGWPGIFLMGYFLTCGWMRRYDGLIAAGGVLSFFVSLWLARTRADYQDIVCNETILMVLMSSAVFVAILHAERLFRPFGRVFRAFSGYSYSLLLIHFYVLNNFVYSGWLSSRLSPVLQVVLPIVSCLFLSLALSALVDHTVLAAMYGAIGRLTPKKRVQNGG